MDDEANDTGLGGLAWYQLGRMSAQNDRVRSNAIASVLGYRRPQIDANAVLAQNQALATENARLRQELADYKRNYQTLREWAEKASRDLRGLPPKSS
jgi:hypothetical protein